jgi:hypothetical protein
MPETLTDDALCKEGVVVLEKGLGPVQALRFLAMISQQSFDYQPGVSNISLGST